MTRNTRPATTRHSKGRSAPGRAFELDQPCFVYLAVHSAGQRFKVGLSIDPLMRLEQLPEAREIDLTVTLVRRLPNQARASQVERALHKALHPFRLRADHGGDGSTEWFQMESFGRASVLIDLMPDAAEPSYTVVRRVSGGRGSEYVRVAEANVAKALAAVALWRLAARLAGLAVVGEGAHVHLLLRNFRPNVYRAATGLRARLLDVEGSYALRTLRKTKSPASLVRLVSYVGPDSNDLRIDLQRTAVLARLPGGAKLVQHLRDGIGMLRFESRTRAPARDPLTEEEIGAALGRLMEHRSDQPSGVPSLWE
jgi:Meiotically up-regulated gene 113